MLELGTFKPKRSFEFLFILKTFVVLRDEENN